MLEIFSSIKPKSTDEKLVLLRKKEKQLIQKERQIKAELNTLYEDSVTLDKLMQYLDKKQANYQEYQKIAKTYKQEREKMQRILQVTDSLLEHLPEQEIEKFVKSKDFKLYKEVITKFGKQNS